MSPTMCFKTHGCPVQHTYVKHTNQLSYTFPPCRIIALILRIRFQLCCFYRLVVAAVVVVVVVVVVLTVVAVIY